MSDTGLHIIVCIKAIVTQAPRGRVVRTADNSQLNPFDRSAIEAALQLRAQMGGRITALSMGPPVSAMVLAEAVAMGVDDAILACDSTLAGADTLATATTLAAAIAALAHYDLVLFGMRTADSDTGQVGPQTATLLDLPLVTGVHKVTPTAGGVRIERTQDLWGDTYEAAFPVALTIRGEAFKPRDIPLAQLALAFDQPRVAVWDLAKLKLPAQQVGEAGSPTRVLSMRPVKRDRHCTFIEGELHQQVEALIQQLQQKGFIG